MYFIVDEADGSIECNSIEEKNGNKYLVFASTDKNKKVLKNYTELWDGIKYHIKTINGGESNEYEKYFMRIKYNSDDNLPLNKLLNLHDLAIIGRSVFEEDGQYYPQLF